eukprot:gb/GECG01011646.1/.p1 GENE.gb/GECG01011646.1/~~gb/GECG01011646.1/.p1  ORF type:complete len:259 (+),score=34.79 gb/GECG01011646.1/:1-777(+)
MDFHSESMPQQVPQEACPAIWSTEGTKHLPLSHEDVPTEGQETKHPSFFPYDFNGGTAAAISGDDWVVIAADTRLSRGYSILSRKVSKATKITDTCIIATGGCWTDLATLHKQMKMRSLIYKDNHEKEISTPAFAQLLSNTLYMRRLFPYYTFNVIGGIDENGKGAVYTYDAVGSFERVECTVQGAGTQHMMPLLDSLLSYKNRTDEKPKYEVTDAVNILKEAYIGATDRNMFVGDSVEIYVIRPHGTTMETFDLRTD